MNGTTVRAVCALKWMTASRRTRQPLAKEIDGVKYSSDARHHRLGREMNASVLDLVEHVEVGRSQTGDKDVNH